MKHRSRLSIAALSLLSASSPLIADEPLLIAEPPIKVPDSIGGFDFIKIDAVRNRLLANHTGSSSLDVFDLADGKLIKHVHTGKCQDVDIDREAGTYLVSVSKEQKIAVIDAEKLEVIKEVALDGPADAVVFDPAKHELYAGHDDAKNLWVIDTREYKVTASIPIEEAPEVAVYDAASGLIFQNIKSASTLLAIDPASHTVKETWSTAPATGPHGLAYSPTTSHLFCAGANSKLSVVDAKTGKGIGSVDIAKGVDQIAFDPESQRVYCACGSGKISIAQDSPAAVTSLGEVDTIHGARSIAFDAKGHSLWIAYGDDKGSFIQRYKIK